MELDNGKVIKVTRLLKLLACTKHPDAIHLLYIYFQSNDVLSVNDGENGTPVNLYAMEYLATYIEDFPVKLKCLNYTSDDVKLANTYLNKIDIY